MFIHALHVVAAILAVFRITELFLYDRITDKLREKSQSYLWRCPRCLSVWAGLVCTLLYVIFPWANWPFALAWLYLWHIDVVYGKRLVKEGRSIIARVKPDGTGEIERMELTPQEVVNLMNSLIPPAPKPAE